MTTVLIAVDLTEASHHAARVAHDLFGAEATYLAINVGADPLPASAIVGVPSWGIVYPYPSTLTDSQLDDPHNADLARQRAARVAAEAGIEEVTAIGSVGDATQAILRAATENDVDAIVVGSHERGWLKSLLHHSVADEILDASSVPVLVVPPPDTEA